jgi:hypothetical protein
LDIAGKHVGFLSDSDAEDLFATLADCEQNGVVAQAKGTVTACPSGTARPVMKLGLAEPGQLLGSMKTEVSPLPVELPEEQPMPDQHCRGCGKGLPAEAKFCLECGTPVVAVPVPAEEAAVPVPVLPVAPRMAPLASTAQPAQPAGAPDRSSSGPAELSIGSQIAIAIASLLLLIGPFLPWATAGIFSKSGLQWTGNEALLLVGLGAIGLAISAVSLAKKKDSLRFISLYAGVLSLAFSVYYLYALMDQFGESSSDMLEIGIGAGIYLCLVASVVVLLAACAVLFGLEKRRLAPRAQFSGTPTKSRGWWKRHTRLQKAEVIVGAIVTAIGLLAVVAAIVGTAGDTAKEDTVSSAPTVATATTAASVEATTATTGASTNTTSPGATTADDAQASYHEDVQDWLDEWQPKMAEHVGALDLDPLTMTDDQIRAVGKFAEVLNNAAKKFRDIEAPASAATAHADWASVLQGMANGFERVKTALDAGDLPSIMEAYAAFDVVMEGADATKTALEQAAGVTLGD